MRRRKFIQTAATGIVVPTIINGIPANAFSANSQLSELLNPTVDTDHVMVLIFLSGGNDGLNTVIPLDQYGNLSVARPNILIPTNEVLRLNGNSNVGLHPALGGLQTLYNEQKLSIIQSVGYPLPNFSHFRSTDIWTSASDANQVIDSGWLGRYLDSEFPGFPLNYPNANNPDPLAIQLGANLPLLFQGPNAQMAMNVSNPDIFGGWPNGVNDPTDNTPRGTEINYIRTISRQSKSYADALIASYLKGTNVAQYPAANYLGDTLKAVARLIKGGLKTRLYLVGLFGFDTHAEQGKGTGAHAGLLQQLGDAVLAFQRDLEGMNLSKRVIGMTFSEFGRRVKDNASNGTDHGAAGPMFVFGESIQSGVLGANPQISSNVSVNDNVPMQFDFRTIYASVLKDWFCVNSGQQDQILLKKFNSLPIIKNNCSTTSLEDYHLSVEQLRLKCYPNPLVETAIVELNTERGQLQIQLFDPLGRLVKVIYSGKVEAGLHKFSFENENFPPGNYHLRVSHGILQKSVLIQIAH